MSVIELVPARVTSRGRHRGAEYLFRVDYPGLLSGDRPTITLTTDPAAALAYTDPQSLEAMLLLVRSLGYNARAVTTDPVSSAVIL